MIQLRPYQQESVDKTIRYLSRRPGKPLIALPTGSGKTLVIADLIYRLPDTARIVVISHVKEIIEQNYNTAIEYLGERNCIVPLGIHSAGLKRREYRQVTFASIQTMFAAKDFHSFDFAIIDEAHSIPPSDGRYGKFLERFKGRVIGLTATPYRLGWGYIYGEDSMFTELVIDYTQGDKFVKMIDDGYLCNLSTKQTKQMFDTQGVKLTGGDFDLKQLSQKIDIESITSSAIKEIIDLGKDKKKWLIFAIDIEHAEHIAETLIKRGIRAMAIHSKLDFNRDAIIQMFRDGHFQAMVNVNILTTGFDDSDIDLIALMRPTTSASLHVQMIGRGLRVAQDKENCLVLDFAGNTSRLGPINDVIVRQKGRKGNGEAPVKTCPECSEIVSAGIKKCPSCGHTFEFKSNLEITASSAEIIATGKKKKWIKVEHVNYKVYKKKNVPDMFLVIYQTNVICYKEYICLEHKGFARAMAEKWMDKFCNRRYDTAEEMSRNVNSFKIPNMIKVKRDGKYDKILDYSL